MTRHQQFLDNRWDKNGNAAPRWVNVPEGKKAPRGAVTRTIGGPTPAIHTWPDALPALDVVVAITSEAVQHQEDRRRRRHWPRSKRSCLARLVAGLSFNLVRLPERSDDD